jgi:hypothetical protein
LRARPGRGLRLLGHAVGWAAERRPPWVAQTVRVTECVAAAHREGGGGSRVEDAIGGGA